MRDARLVVEDASIVVRDALGAPGVPLFVVKDASVVMVNGKTSVEVPAKISNAEKKFDETRLLYNHENGKDMMEGIEFGGTRTKLQFDSGVRSGGGQ